MVPEDMIVRIETTKTPASRLRFYTDLGNALFSTWQELEKRPRDSDSLVAKFDQLVDTFILASVRWKRR